LRGYALVQDESRYDEVDQQVWRYVLRRVFARLTESAHPAYASGLVRAGMTVDRIPNIDEMDERLADFGWGAVCVDGFLPPRAFQEFQAHGLLPINAEIRTPEHILYTPSPDILHEAAGHAPILPEPKYADYLRRIGRIGTRAFASADDERVYQAIYQLSEVKESPSATKAEVALAEQALAAALAAVKGVSEAARISRLYWWTAEYGLVGRVDRYQLYGAGLLSSLGESASCHDPRVRKIPLSAACVETDYDITREQPQLFVAADFDHLHDVLDEVAAGLAQRIGGEYALSAAEASGEVSTVELDSGVQITGRVAGVERGAVGVALIRWAGRVGLGRGDKLFDRRGNDGGKEPCAEGGRPIPRRDGDSDSIAVLGPLFDGRSASRLLVSDLASLANRGTAEIRFRSGIVLRGALRGHHADLGGRITALSLDGARVSWGDRLVFQANAGQSTDWALGDEVATAFAGAADSDYWPPHPPSFRIVPAPRAPRSAIALLDRAPSWPPSSGAFSAGRM
jgi:phenylalanine-4-hydroxylase